MTTDYSKEQLVDALTSCYDSYLHDTPMDGDVTLDEYIKSLEAMTYSQLIKETGTDDAYTIQEFMYAWS